MMQRRSSRGLVAAQLGGIVCQLISVTVADERSLISKSRSLCDVKMEVFV